MMKMKKLYLLCGPSGSGKSTFARKVLNGEYVSRDEVRFSLVKENEDYFSHEKQVFNSFAHTIDSLLDNGDDVIADATHINKASRMKLLKTLELDNVAVISVVVKPSLETALKRNSKREGRMNVPEDVIRRMYSQWEDPTMNEYSYAAILTVNAEEDFR